MLDFLNAVQTELLTTAATVWPEVANNWLAIEVERVNWSDLLESGQMTLPYVVLQIASVEESDEWSGLDNALFEIEVVLHYIAQVSDTVTDGINTKLLAMQRYLRSHEFATMQVLEERRQFDSSEGHPMNAVFLNSISPLQAGSIRLVCLAGDIAE